MIRVVAAGRAARWQVANASVRPRRDDDVDYIEVPLSTATTVLEYEQEPMGVLMVDHRGRPLLARMRDPIGFNIDFTS